MDSNGAIEKLKSWPVAIRDYYGELRNEMKRVTWPSRKQVEGTTTVVIFSVFAFAGYFWIVDGILSSGVNHVFKFFAK
jgi:preprotein translocase subunit SecE